MYVAAIVYNAAAICCLLLFVNAAHYVSVTVCNVAAYKSCHCYVVNFGAVVCNAVGDIYVAIIVCEYCMCVGYWM